MSDVILEVIALVATAVAFYNIGVLVQHSRREEAAEEFANEFLEELIARCEEAGITDTELVARNMRELNAEQEERFNQSNNN